MTLMKSISGIRGTIGGVPGEGLTPDDIVKYTAAYAHWLKAQNQGNGVVVGRDARLSGPMVQSLVNSTLQMMGMDVIDLGLATTPTVELAVVNCKAAGGIILTASHNPIQWNALKLLNHQGEFISAEGGAEILEIASNTSYNYAVVKELGSYRRDESQLDKHIQAILDLPLVNKEAIENARFKIVVDAVNSVGGVAVPALLRALGVKEVVELYCEPNGYFPHNPEPLPENLGDISSEVRKNNAQLGIVVDPDVDRLCFVCEDGEMFGEEYTLVAVADYVLRHQKGNTVSNLSSTRALRDVSQKYGVNYAASAVGEVNVVKKMKETDAVIGGEGNGGIIYPELHYGRDALVGIALFLSHLAESGKSAAALKMGYPRYIISKNKIELNPDLDVDEILRRLAQQYAQYDLNEEDGLKIDFEDGWVHLRKSNTEPIIRIYSESGSETQAKHLAEKIIRDIFHSSAD